MKQTNCVTIAFLLSGIAVYAQEVVSTAGSYGETTSGSLSWTVGEPVTETITDGTNTLTQGFQQSKLTVTAINDMKVSGIELSVYPNPTADYLVLSIDDVKTNDHSSQLSLQLYDMNGKLLQNEKISGNETSIDMSNFIPGTYILKIFQEKDNSTDAKFCVSYKIIKK